MAPNLQEQLDQIINLGNVSKSPKDFEKKKSPKNTKRKKSSRIKNAKAKEQDRHVVSPKVKRVINNQDKKINKDLEDFCEDMDEVRQDDADPAALQLLSDEYEDDIVNDERTCEGINTIENVVDFK